MKLFHDSTSCLLRLLLLAELFVHSSSRPTRCRVFGSLMHQVDRLMSASKKIHNLTEDELRNFAAVEHRLDSLPHFQHTAAHFSSLKVNESFSELHAYTQSFRLHLDWLKNAKHNISLSSKSLEGASDHLLEISNLINTSLQQMGAEPAQPPPSPSLPAVSTAFDALHFSVELSERLQSFCDMSKRTLRLLQTQTRCHRH